MARLSFPASLQRGLCAALLAALMLTACGKKEETQPPPQAPEEEKVEAPAPPAVTFALASFDDLPGWSRDSLAEALPAIRRSCTRLDAQPAERALGPDGMAGTVADWRGPCAALQAAEGDAALRRELESRFRPVAVSGPEGPEGFFTGYYEVELEAARQPDATYRWPLYRKPGDIVSADLGLFRADWKDETILGRVNEEQRLVPYWARGEIESGVLSGRDLELVWLKDPVESFFLHVQGSGRLRLPDGATQRVGFAASNGRPFTAIGKLLLDEGLIPREEATAQGVMAWLRDNPEQAVDLMNRNARYIFFREIEGEGPVGAQGVALTSGRSLAVDPALLPLGAPVWLDTTSPIGGEPLQRLMVAQDTGSAIKGAVRGDVFFGTGEQALELAGRMKQDGRYWLLLPTPIAERLTGTS